MYFLSELCFLCLNSYKNIKLVPIRSSEGVLIQQKLIYCLSEIAVESHLGIPKYMCDNCINKLEGLYKFKQTCLQNNTYLENYSQILKSGDNSHMYLSVRLTDVKYQKNQMLPTVENNKEVEAVFTNEIWCATATADVLDMEDETDIIVKEEFPSSVNNADHELYSEYVKSIKSETISNDSDDSNLRIEDIVQEDPKYLNNNTEKTKVKKTFQCALCSKVFIRKQDLGWHLERHAGITYKCSKCEKRYLHKRSLILHQKIHANLKKLDCLLCEKKFIYQASLFRHQQTHAGNKNFECSVCKKKFLLKSNMVRHEKNHGIKTVQCLICKKMYSHKKRLIEHQKIHAERTFECSICNKKFNLKSTLVAHEKDHTNFKSFECSVCKKRYTRLTTLKEHERVHLGLIKKFECSTCNMKLASKTSLYRHIRVHAGKYFECSVCHKKYNREPDLSHHEKIHKNNN